MKQLKKIILVEDEEDIRSITQIALQDLGGFTLLCCGSGKEAMEKIEAFQPDLLLLDVMMPGMDGPTTLKNIRNLPSEKDIPCIFMTAKTQAHEVAQYTSMNVLDIIIKPFDPMTLASTIHEIWEKHHG